MKTNRIACSLVFAATLAGAQSPGRSETISMVFSNTEVSQALKAISLRTGAGIIYVGGKEKLSVTLNLTVNTAEEAVKSISSAAGLAYRKVDKLYVVAPPTSMRQALEPYGYRVSFTPKNGKSTDFSARLQEELPYSTVRATGDKISVFGILSDVNRAREILSDLEAQEEANRPTTDIVMLRQAPANQIAPLLTGLYPEVKVSATGGDKGPSALGLTGPAIQVQAARATAEKLDIGIGPGKDVFRVYDIKYTSGPSLAEFLKQAVPTVEALTGPESFIPRRANFNPLTSQLTSNGGSNGGGQSGGQTGSSGGTSTQGNSTSGTTTEPPVRIGDRAKIIVLRGPADDVESAIRLLAEIDRKPKQVVVEVNVVETSPSNESQAGFQWDWNPIDFVETLPSTLLGKDPDTGRFLPDPITSRPAGVGQISRVPWNFRTILNAMVTRQEARILAKPSVQVVDNGQAYVFIGDTIRARITQQGALGAQNVDIREFPVGIILLISPRVNSDGNITMHVNPVVSSVTSVDAFNVPTTSAREAETTAIVKSGETVVIGGLIRDSDIKTVQEVPFLSKLPIIGELFKNRVRNHRRNEIIVTITPHIIEDEPIKAGGK